MSYLKIVPEAFLRVC